MLKTLLVLALTLCAGGLSAASGGAIFFETAPGELGAVTKKGFEIKPQNPAGALRRLARWGPVGRLHQQLHQLADLFDQFAAAGKQAPVELVVEPGLVNRTTVIKIKRKGAAGAYGDATVKLRLEWFGGAFMLPRITIEGEFSRKITPQFYVPFVIDKQYSLAVPLKAFTYDEGVSFFNLFILNTAGPVSTPVAAGYLSNFFDSAKGRHYIPVELKEKGDTVGDYIDAADDLLGRAGPVGAFLQSVLGVTDGTWTEKTSARLYKTREANQFIIGYEVGTGYRLDYGHMEWLDSLGSLVDGLDPIDQIDYPERYSQLDLDNVGQLFFLTDFRDLNDGNPVKAAAYERQLLSLGTSPWQLSAISPDRNHGLHVHALTNYLNRIARQYGWLVGHGVVDTFQNDALPVADTTWRYRGGLPNNQAAREMLAALTAYYLDLARLGDVEAEATLIDIYLGLRANGAGALGLNFGLTDQDWLYHDPGVIFDNLQMPTNPDLVQQREWMLAPEAEAWGENGRVLIHPMPYQGLDHPQDHHDEKHLVRPEELHLRRFPTMPGEILVASNLTDMGLGLPEYSEAYDIYEFYRTWDIFGDLHQDGVPIWERPGVEFVLTDDPYRPRRSAGFDAWHASSMIGAAFGAVPIPELQTLGTILQLPLQLKTDPVGGIITIVGLFDPEAGRIAGGGYQIAQELFSESPEFANIAQGLATIIGGDFGAVIKAGVDVYGVHREAFAAVDAGRLSADLANLATALSAVSAVANLFEGEVAHRIGAIGNIGSGLILMSAGNIMAPIGVFSGFIALIGGPNPFARPIKVFRKTEIDFNGLPPIDELHETWVYNPNGGYEDEWVDIVSRGRIDTPLFDSSGFGDERVESYFERTYVEREEREDAMEREYVVYHVPGWLGYEKDQINTRDTRWDDYYRDMIDEVLHQARGAAREGPGWRGDFTYQDLLDAFWGQAYDSDGDGIVDRKYTTHTRTVRLWDVFDAFDLLVQDVNLDGTVEVLNRDAEYIAYNDHGIDYGLGVAQAHLRHADGWDPYVIKYLAQRAGYDFNRDGRPDLILHLDQQRWGTRIFLGMEGWWQEIGALHGDDYRNFDRAIGEGARADVNGDGILDSVYRAVDNQVWLAWGRSNGAFTEPFRSQVDITWLTGGDWKPNEMEIGDANGDHCADLYLRRRHDGPVTHLILGGPGGFTGPDLGDPAPVEDLETDNHRHLERLAHHDLDGNGQPDVAFRHHRPDDSQEGVYDMEYWLKDTRGRWHHLGRGLVGREEIFGQRLDSVDIDGDGAPDRLYHCPLGGVYLSTDTISEIARQP